MGISSLFSAVTFTPIKKLYGSQTATVVRPIATWAASIPSGYVYVPEYDGFFNGTTRLADISPYWTTDSVEYIPIDMSTDEYAVRYAAFVGIQHFTIGVLGASEITKIKTGYCILIDGVRYRVEKSTLIHPKWCEFVLLPQ